MNVRKTQSRQEILQGKENPHLPTEFLIGDLRQSNLFGASRLYKRNSIIWSAGDYCDRLYFLERGRVSIVTTDRRGREVVLEFVTAGQLFGEVRFRGDSQSVRQTTARATIESLAVEINTDEFISHLKTDGNFLRLFLTTLGTRLAYAERRIAILALHEAETRLGQALLHFAETHGTAINLNQLQCKKLSLTHDELAGLTALSRQRVTIIMNRFRQLGLLSYNRTQPLTVNTERLMQFLETEI